MVQYDAFYKLIDTITAFMYCIDLLRPNLEGKHLHILTNALIKSPLLFLLAYYCKMSASCNSHRNN